MKIILATIIFILSSFSIVNAETQIYQWTYYPDNYYNNSYNYNNNSYNYNNNSYNYYYGYYDNNWNYVRKYSDYYYNDNYNNSYYNNWYYYNGYYYSSNYPQYYTYKLDPTVSHYTIDETTATKKSTREDYYTESEVEETLDFIPGIAEFNLELEELDRVNFSTKTNKEKYNDFYAQDQKMRTLIIKLYEEWELTEYEVNGVIKNYKDFIYYTNQYFYYLKTQEKNPKLKKDDEVNDALLKNYKNSQSSFKKVKAVILNR
jgi:hypothetical protein